MKRAVRTPARAGSPPAGPGRPPQLGEVDGEGRCPRPPGAPLVSSPASRNGARLRPCIAGRRGHPQQAQQGGGVVHHPDQEVALRPLGEAPLPEAQQEGDVDQLLPRLLLVVVSVRAQHRAVVAAVHHQGVLQGAPLAQEAQQAPHLGVQGGDVGVVPGQVAPPRRRSRRRSGAGSGRRGRTSPRRRVGGARTDRAGARRRRRDRRVARPRPPAAPPATPGPGRSAPPVRSARPGSPGPVTRPGGTPGAGSGGGTPRRPRSGRSPGGPGRGA